ncbi:MAG TPA: Flp pilus assembly protein CpaB [Chloroflexota bacterium]|nr:Flp pilus assembly protein CpaB [Chloroflexota bacterium]
MDTTSKWLFGAGAALALLVGVAVYFALTAAAGLGRGTTTVVVARQEIPERTLFTGTNVGDLLTTRQLPADGAPPDALHQPADAIGKATTRSLVAGEIVLGTPDRLASGEGAGARAAAVIPRDKVAVAIPATDAVTVAGALQPGDRVDVIGTWTRPDGLNATQNMFHDVRVFAVGRWQGSGGGTATSAASGGNASTITLLLDYQQAVVVEYLLQSGGHLSVALRRFDQGEDVPTEPATAETVTRRYYGLDGQASLP